LEFYFKYFIQTIQQQQTGGSTKNIHVSTTPNVMQPQQRSATSAHVNSLS
jgi:hypothetical protein